MKPNLWFVILGVVAALLILYAGIQPPPVQKDNPALHSQPSAPGPLPQPAPSRGPTLDDLPLK